ncbi:hypothetical protein HNR46_001619 [Haloferula luteola]|uniref:Uncharacterized protein n=1 Tax=Haloferula luteola TaxID=595692 RepID=A0A840V1U6_9BACT|nr:hypothetical protein [Haloferula luteola]MBB5351383.1 hypothetical protein [Haloferula luteola]
MKPTLSKVAAVLRGSLRIRKDEPAPPMPASLPAYLERHFAAQDRGDFNGLRNLPTERYPKTA